MEDNVTSLKDVKNLKRAKKLMEDLDKTIHIMNLSLQSLSFFKKYVPVQEVISSLQTNKTLLEIHCTKLKKFVSNGGKSL